MKPGVILPASALAGRCKWFAEATAQGDAVQSIQWLRGFAALLVVAFHLSIAPWGPSGVDVFFLISGFIMWITTDQRELHPLAFYRNRLLRIIPLYWLYTTLLALAIIAIPAAFTRLHFDWSHLLTSYLFVPAVSPTNGLVTPFLVQGWSLNYEMFFYAVFGATLVLPARLRIAKLSASLLGLILLGVWLQPASVVGQTYADPLLAEFLAGVWIGWLWRRGALRLPVPLATLALIVAVAQGDCMNL